MQTKLTVTGELFHPAAFGAGATDATTCSGGNGCRLNWILVVAVFPAMSVALPLKVCRPAVVTVIGDGQMATPDKLSLQVNVTVAEIALTIPLASGAGETDGRDGWRRFVQIDGNAGAGRLRPQHP